MIEVSFVGHNAGTSQRNRHVCFTFEKQTCAVQLGMSALPLKADIGRSNALPAAHRARAGFKAISSGVHRRCQLDATLLPETLRQRCQHREPAQRRGERVRVLFAQRQQFLPG